MMIKKGSVLLLVLLVSLPGCARKEKKADQPKKGRQMTQKADAFKSVNLPLAAGEELEIDESMRSFFDDMEEFVSFAQEGDFNLEAGSSAGNAIKRDEFAWQDAEDDDTKLESIYFGFNKDKVDSAEKEKIEQNIDKAKKMLAEAKVDDTDAILVVEGHACASAGSDAYNMGISERRAKEISDRLVSAGIPRDDIKTVGRGKEMLVIEKGDQAEQWANRRVETHIAFS